MIAYAVFLCQAKKIPHRQFPAEQKAFFGCFFALEGKAIINNL
jgi:hypothetical protein